MTKIALDKKARADAITSIRRYFEENFPEPIGELPAGLLLNYFLEEIAPAIYNQAVADAQTRIEQRLMDLPGELFAESFQYWAKVDGKGKARR